MNLGGWIWIFPSSFLWPPIIFLVDSQPWGRQRLCLVLCCVPDCPPEKIIGNPHSLQARPCSIYLTCIKDTVTIPTLSGRTWGCWQPLPFFLGHTPWCQAHPGRGHRQYRASDQKMTCRDARRQKSQGPHRKRLKNKRSRWGLGKPGKTG